ncbi:Gfo/Idh/MocA family oxidoreductase [Subtercola sp. PAMC28395]|uniref:Gfo/Idh/MocA family protein n=1 Tax=Subtercola sp. PAMC28395 TaxID=2846775 RepID=UPI001C0E235A|nr:Gfo/Idh/MocA family oxidoreductase [Subtercola sp. PAMC28395]QWT24975.1 Gfo/Idh/MocA family oxidoreductase [Subtercola sp. PAMC28395]
MARTIRWGILGTGGIASAFATDLLANDLVLSAVGSRSVGGAEEFAAKFGNPTAHGSYEELVSDPDVDAIYVATPHPLHVANTLLALRAGKHVLVEKPFTLNALEAQLIADEAERSKLVVLEAMWTRFLPHMVRIREIIAAGTLGEVHTVLADHDQKLPSDPSHRLNDPALGGGALLDLGIYPVSFAIDVLGLPTRILASATTTSTGVDRQTAIILEHGETGRSVLHCALDSRGPNVATVIGTEARIEIDDTWYAPTTFRVIDPEGTVIESFEHPVVSRGMQYQAVELERLVNAGLRESELLPVSESVAIMGVLDEVRRQIGLVYPGE